MVRDIVEYINKIVRREYDSALSGVLQERLSACEVTTVTLFNVILVIAATMQEPEKPINTVTTKGYLLRGKRNKNEPASLLDSQKETYNSGDSLVVTDPTTNPPLTGLSMGERTGSRVLQWVWSYVKVCRSQTAYSPRPAPSPLRQEVQLQCRHNLLAICHFGP